MQTNASQYNRDAAWSRDQHSVSFTCICNCGGGPPTREQHAKKESKTIAEKLPCEASVRESMSLVREKQSCVRKGLTKCSFTPEHPNEDHKPTLNAQWRNQQERIINTPTCFSGSSMNSSVLDTSTKCCRTYLCADLSRSLQECVSANPRMPRQLEGSSWLSRNLQQASRTPLSCSRLAAGSRV